jgi:isopropylmalate/homocitrate/citramalate synthase
MTMKKLLSAAALAALIAVASSPALAFRCPTDMKKIDAALAGNSYLTAEQTTQATKLRGEGAAQHKAGNHQSAIDKLAEALAILGIK